MEIYQQAGVMTCLSVNYVQAISHVASVKMPSVSWEFSNQIPLA